MSPSFGFVRQRDLILSIHGNGLAIPNNWFPALVTNVKEDGKYLDVTVVLALPFEKTFRLVGSDNIELIRNGEMMTFKLTPSLEIPK